MYVTESKVNQQNIVINKLLCPQGINLAGSPNIIPDIGALAYDVGSSVLYYGDGTIWTPLAANTGSPISISNFGSSPNLKGLTLMGSVLNLEPANVTFPGGISTTAQTLSGVKTFNDSVILPTLSSPGIVHNDASGNLSTSLIVNADISASAAITDNKLNPISTAGKVLNSSTTATSTNTPSTIVLRDGSNNFSAGTITATTFVGNLTGNASSSTSFSGNLSGDVTGPQTNTVVAQVSSVAASLIASGATLANAATSISTPNTIVKRDGSGGFSAGTIIGSFTGNLAGNATSATSATNWTGILLGDVTGTQSATVVSQVGAVSASLIASGATLANNASTSTNGTIVKRDGSGNFSAGTITATFIGNLTGNVTGNATSSTNSVSFSGPLLGDVTGNQSSTVVSFVGGLGAASVASGAILANAATSVNTASTIVRRDVNGDFSATTITNTNSNISGVINLSNTTSTSVGMINKGVSRWLHNYGTNNTFLGINSGNLSLTSARCVGFGNSTLQNLTSGNDCTASGYQALMSVTSTNFHTAFGSGALRLTTTGTNCSAFGYNALTSNVGGDGCCAFGSSCLSSNTSGINNTGYGLSALRLITTNSNCTAFGCSALEVNTSDSMTAFGSFALGSNTTGVRSTAMGVTALEDNITGNDCTAFGFQALASSLGSGNIGIGSNAGGNIVNSSNNIDIGNQGVLGDSGVIRFGTLGTQLKNFQAGIRGITGDLSDSIPVYITSTGQLTTVSTSKASGNINAGGGNTTAVLANTWTMLTGITSSSALNNFTRPLDNRMVYTGAATGNFLVTISLTFSSSVAGSLYAIIGKNGSPASGAQGPIAVGIGVYENFSPSSVISLATNDYLSIMVQSTVAGTMSYSFASISAISA